MNTIRSWRGFSLIEVLIALVVISIGLLGVAALEGTTLGNTTGARGESVMAVEAQSLADEMTANTGYWRAGVFPLGQFTVTGATISDATLNATAADCTAAACTPLQLAGYDLKQWGNDLQAQMPSAVGKITCAIGVAGAPNVCTITVSWTVKSTAAVNAGMQKTAAAETAQMTYALINAL